MSTCRLSVNLNKVALIRNARGANFPNLLQVALDCEKFGAEGITVHPRPDQRHIRYDDIPDLRGKIATEFNIEGNPTPEFMDLLRKYPSDQVTLVPDAAQALTSDSGWDTLAFASFLQEVTEELKSLGARVSIFVDPDPKMIEGAKKLGADRVELYTGPYAHEYKADRAAAIAPYVKAAEAAAAVGIELNAGHDLNLVNLAYFKQNIPNLLEVSIGHALTVDALYMGFQNVIPLYKNCLR